MNERTIPTLAFAALMACMPMAHAQAEAASKNIGQSAHAWLALQAANSAAAPAQPMTGAQAGAAYTRYMKSFDTPIPDRYGSSFGSGGRASPDLSAHDAN
jgi:hypothetical protein